MIKKILILCFLGVFMFVGYANATVTNFDKIKFIQIISKYILRSQSIIPRSTADIEATAIIDASSLYKIPIPIIVGVAQTESNFQPWSISSAKAIGPMQVIYKIHAKKLEQIGITNKRQLFDPYYGIIAGTYLLHVMGYNKHPKQTLYIYSGKNKNYASKVFYNAGAFIAYSNIVVANFEQTKAIVIKIKQSIPKSKPKPVVNKKKNKKDKKLQ